MAAVLIARFKNKKEANLASRLIRSHIKSSQMVSGDSMEDLYLGEMIQEGMKSKSMSSKNFKKYLDQRIKEASV
ncbi:MAG: hypothetical protein JST43_01050 [Bacteroidetes bacterium]|nr:hypothetical protein [Bacteroidota bacterium]MBS1540655.1 hypothetical protein [Bacteroidota bacterium]